MKLDDELKDLSPLLREIRQRDANGGMSRPPEYFDTLEEQVFSQLEAIGARRKPAATAPQTAWWNLLFSPRIALALGVGTLLLAAGGWWLWQQTTNPAPDFAPVAAVELSAEEAEIYLLNNAEELEPELLAAHLPDENELDLPNSEPGNASPDKLDDLRPEDLEHMLDELSEEEIKALF